MTKANRSTLLELAALGRTNKQIAVELELSERTVKNSFTIIYESMGAKNRANAVALAISRGIIEGEQIPHMSLDEMIADFTNWTGKLPMNTTIFELMKWSYSQTTNDDSFIQFASPQTPQQADMLEYLKSLSPTKRTELLGELYSQWETWRNEQVLNQSVYKEGNNY